MTINTQKIINAISCYWNKYKFQRNGIKVGSHFRGLGFIKLKIDPHYKAISIGDHFILQSGNFRNALSRDWKACIQVDFGASLKIGDNVRMSDVVIWARQSIEIQSFTTFGGGVVIMDSNAHPIDYNLRRIDGTDEGKSAIVHKPVVIEEDAFIGAFSIICKGVTIGARSIIAAGSVVVNSIPPDVIAGGNPCKVIKQINSHRYGNY